MFETNAEQAWIQTKDNEGGGWQRRRLAMRENFAAFWFGARG